MIKCSTFLFLSSLTCFSILFSQDSSYLIYDSRRIGITAGEAINIVQLNLQKSIKQKAPPLEFHTIFDSLGHNLTELAGNVVMLNFWGRGCKICIQEMPDIDQLQDDYDRAGLKVLYLTNEDYETQNRFFETHKTSGLKGWVDSWKLLKPYQLGMSPMTILIDRNGIIQDGWFGAIGYDAMEKRINVLIPHEQKRLFASVSQLVRRLPMPPLYVYCACSGILLILVGLASTLIRRRNKNANVA